MTLPDGSTALQGGRSRRGKPRGLPGSREWSSALKGCDDPLFIDFLKRCLEWDPLLRMTPAQALKHSWLRRRLPKPPNENPPPSRRSSAAYRHTIVPKMNGTGGAGIAQHNILNNTSNTVMNNTLRHVFNNGSSGNMNGTSESDLNKHTKLPKIGGSNNNLRDS